MFQRRQWQWRPLTTLVNAALGKPVIQSSEERCCAQGDPRRAVDGLLSNRYDAQPYTCTHTAGNRFNSALETWLMVDLGDVYDVQVCGWGCAQ